MGGLKGNIAHSPLRSSLQPNAGPSCEHTSCMSFSSFLSSYWESRVGHSFPATISSYSLIRTFPHSSRHPVPPPTPPCKLVARYCVHRSPGVAARQRISSLASEGAARSVCSEEAALSSSSSSSTSSSSSSPGASHLYYCSLLAAAKSKAPLV